MNGSAQYHCTRMHGCHRSAGSRRQCSVLATIFSDQWRDWDWNRLGGMDGWMEGEGWSDIELFVKRWWVVENVHYSSRYRRGLLLIINEKLCIHLDWISSILRADRRSVHKWTSGFSCKFDLQTAVVLMLLMTSTRALINISLKTRRHFIYWNISLPK